MNKYRIFQNNCTGPMCWRTTGKLPNASIHIYKKKRWKKPRFVAHYDSCCVSAWQPRLKTIRHPSLRRGVAIKIVINHQIVMIIFGKKKNQKRVHFLCPWSWKSVPQRGLTQVFLTTEKSLFLFQLALMRESTLCCHGSECIAFHGFNVRRNPLNRYLRCIKQ